MDYSERKLSELRTMAKERGLRNISSLNKAELVELLQNVEKMINHPVEKTTEQKKVRTSSAGGKDGGKTAKPEKKKEEKKTAGRKTTRKKEEAGMTEISGGTRKTAARTRNTRSTEGVKRTMETTGTSKTTRTTRTTRTMRTTKDTIRNAEEPEKLRRPVSRHSEAPAGNKRTPQISAETSQTAARVPADQQKETQDLMVYDGQEYRPQDADGTYANGLIEVMNEGYGFIRSDNYMPGDRDIYVSPAQIRRFGLRTGDILKGPVRRKISEKEKFKALLYIESVNGTFPSALQNRRKFENMTPVFPNERIHLDSDHAPVALRIVDLFSPIGKGQRGMIVSPPKAGKTTLLKLIAKRISVAYPDIHMLVLLIDERPEEVTDIRESIAGPNVEVIYSTFDELPEHHKRVSEMSIERAKRLVESGNDVVILIDSITRLARAYNLTVPPSGRTLSGGLDPAALHMPKKFFGAARNMREGGSLTILATALIDTGSRMDDMVFEEFKGTGNMELVLNRNLSEKRVFPAIDIEKSGTRRDDLLLDPDEQEVLGLIHDMFRDMKPEEVTEHVIRLLSKTRNNREFIEMARKMFRHRG